MDENEAEAPVLSPLKKASFRGSILKRKFITKDDSSLDETLIEKSERKPRRVSFAAAPQIRVFQKEMRHKSIGGSVVCLKKKEYPKKTGDLKARAITNISSKLIDDNMGKADISNHRYSIASNRDAETVSIDSFVHTTNSVDISSAATFKHGALPRKMITEMNSPVRRSPRLLEKEAIKASTSLCDFLLQSNRTEGNLDTNNDELTMPVDISCIFNRMDDNTNLNVSNENMEISITSNDLNLLELSPTTSPKATTDHNPINNNIMSNNNTPQPSITSRINPTDEDWSMNLSNHNNSSLRTHNLISMETSLIDEIALNDDNSSILNISEHNSPHPNTPIFYQVDLMNNSNDIDIIDDDQKLISTIDCNNRPTNTHNSSLSPPQMIDIDIGDNYNRDNADIVYETFLNKSNWFLDKISEINMDYTAKLIHSGSFHDSNCWGNGDNTTSRINIVNNTLFDDQHQATDDNIVDMDISSYSCVQGIERLANDAKQTFVALNSIFNITTNGDNMDNNNTVNETIPNISDGNDDNFMSLPDPSHIMNSFAMPSILGDDLFDDILIAIKTIRDNLEESNRNLSDNLNNNQTRLIQPLQHRNNQAELNNKELATKINELFTSLSDQKINMTKYQVDEQNLHSSIARIKSEIEGYSFEVKRKTLIENLESELAFSTFNIELDQCPTTTNYCLKLNNLLKLYFEYNVNRLVVLDIVISTTPLDGFPICNMCIKSLINLLNEYNNHLKDYFNEYLTPYSFANKIMTLTFKFYEIYFSFNIINQYNTLKYPMKFIFHNGSNTITELTFKLYSGNFVYTQITLRFALTNTLECIIKSYEVVDLFKLYQSDILVTQIKDIIENVLSKSLCKNIHMLFSSLETVTSEFHSRVSLQYNTPPDIIDNQNE